jgi:hypothetical protein
MTETEAECSVDDHLCEREGKKREEQASSVKNVKLLMPRAITTTHIRDRLSSFQSVWILYSGLLDGLAIPLRPTP